MRALRDGQAAKQEQLLAGAYTAREAGIITLEHAHAGDAVTMDVGSKVRKTLTSMPWASRTTLKGKGVAQNVSLQLRKGMIAMRA